MSQPRPQSGIPGSCSASRDPPHVWVRTGCSVSPGPWREFLPRDAQVPLSLCSQAFGLLLPWQVPAPCPAPCLAEHWTKRTGSPIPAAPWAQTPRMQTARRPGHGLRCAAAGAHLSEGPEGTRFRLCGHMVCAARAQLQQLLPEPGLRCPPPPALSRAPPDLWLSGDPAEPVSTWGFRCWLPLRGPQSHGSHCVWPPGLWAGGDNALPHV